jgi:hypothetical protein
VETRYGYTLEQWEAAREEIRQILIRTAGSRSVITYTDLCLQVKAIHIEPHDRALPYFLGEVCTDEHDAGRPLLTAIVIYKNDPSKPADGFLDLADSLGYDTGVPDSFWIGQVRAAHDLWSGAGAPDPNKL